MKNENLNKESSENEPKPKDNLVTTKHKVTINNKELKYTVTTGTVVLSCETTNQSDRKGEFEGEKPKAEIFYTAYIKDNVRNINKRPITFAFNGGPGSASVWLHMGMLGPKIVKLDDATYSKPPFELIDNEYSLLDKTDLVFIDPVGTGYSRPVEGEKAKDFHNLDKDIESLAFFIRLYLGRNERWLSPKFLAGESYGTTRSAGLAGYLQEKLGIYLNGLMLISSVLDFSTLRFASNNDMPYALYFPSYVATAYYYKKLSKNLLEMPLEELLAEVKDFVANEYVAALWLGSSLSKESRTEIINKLAHYSGLKKEYIDRTDLRIEIRKFCKELLRDEGKTVGRLDSRFSGIDKSGVTENFEFDPAMAAITGPYTAVFNDYIAKELKYQSDKPYEVLSYEVFGNWTWGKENQYVDVSETLRKAISMNPHLKVHVTNGYFDLATPFLATEYTFQHMGLNTDLQENISMSYYDAGHMMYLHKPSLIKLKEKLSKFISEAK